MSHVTELSPGQLVNQLVFKARLPRRPVILMSPFNIWASNHEGISRDWPQSPGIGWYGRAS
jgi:hypothetical protein